jgi:hypothetical protein
MEHTPSLCGLARAGPDRPHRARVSQRTRRSVGMGRVSADQEAILSLRESGCNARRMTLTTRWRPAAHAVVVVPIRSVRVGVGNVVAHREVLFAEPRRDREFRRRRRSRDPAAAAGCRSCSPLRVGVGASTGLRARPRAARSTQTWAARRSCVLRRYGFRQSRIASHRTLKVVWPVTVMTT